MAATYTLLKYLHVACVVLSGTGFVPRGVWMMRGSPMLARRWVRVVRITTFWGALPVFAYIVAVAVTKSVVPYVS